MGGHPPGGKNKLTTEQQLGISQNHDAPAVTRASARPGHWCLGTRAWVWLLLLPPAQPLPLPTVLFSSRTIQRQESSCCRISAFHVSPACISWIKPICIQSASCKGVQGISASFPFQALQEGRMEVSQLTPTGEYPHIFKLKKYKSIALELVSDTIFLPGIEMLSTKISFFSVWKILWSPRGLGVYYLRVFPHFHNLDGPLKKKLPLWSQSTDKQLERIPAIEPCTYSPNGPMSCLSLPVRGSSSQCQLRFCLHCLWTPHTIRKRSHLK